MHTTRRPILGATAIGAAAAALREMIGLYAPEGDRAVRRQLEGIIDVDAERPRIAKVIAGLEASIARSRGKLDNPNFRDKAPAEVIEQEQARLAEVEVELAKQQRQLAELG